MKLPPCLLRKGGVHKVHSVTVIDVKLRTNQNKHMHIPVSNAHDIITDGVDTCMNGYCYECKESVIKLRN